MRFLKLLTEIECSGCSDVVTVNAVDKRYVINSGSTCGQQACPLRLKAQPGQGFDIYAYDLVYTGDIQSSKSVEDLTSSELNSCTYSINYKVNNRRNVISGFVSFLSSFNVSQLNKIYFKQNQVLKNFLSVALYFTANSGTTCIIRILSQNSSTRELHHLFTLGSSIT